MKNVRALLVNFLQENSDYSYGVSWIAECLDSSSTSVLQHLKKLESEGLAFSRPDPEIGIISNRGGNAKVWRLTASGMDLEV